MIAHFFDLLIQEFSTLNVREQELFLAGGIAGVVLAWMAFMAAESVVEFHRLSRRMYGRFRRFICGGRS
tara:strand:- start:3037 stop:3243 length:207 start_codon:yes stop_codon:yes gene_type:complete